MAQVHVAHDCLRVTVISWPTPPPWPVTWWSKTGANIGAYSGVHQFCRVGKEAYVGGYSVVVKDALPFALTVGNHASCYGLNITGMKRRGYPKGVIDALHHAFHLLLSAKLNTTQAAERIRSEIPGSAEVTYLLRFIEDSNRGVTK
jgi:UDP-N-acetylglucosamine acyltransferase